MINIGRTSSHTEWGKMCIGEEGTEWKTHRRMVVPVT